MSESLNSIRRVFAVLLLVLSLTTVGAAGADPLYPDFDALLGEIARIENIGDATQRAAELDAFWDGLIASERVPYAQDGRVAMMYRGEAAAVGFAGDFNQWDPEADPARRVPGTDLWLRELTLPDDARVDYKIVQGGAWVLDPNNPHRQWSGFGPNSELRMPAYVFPAETVRSPGVDRGTLGDNQLVKSDLLNTGVYVRVYRPAGYDELDNLPVVYVTDGQEYLDERLGAMVNVLDNLIHDGRLRPTIAVFIDPRDPTTGANRRMGQLGEDGKAVFADFIARELIPTIDRTYRTQADPEARVILGTSLGGLFSAYMGARHPGAVGKVAIQSPAFWFDPSIYNTYRDNPQLAERLTICMVAGTINAGEGGPTMNDILEGGGFRFTYHTVNQGHSWGHWKGEIDTVLVNLLGPPKPADD